MKSGERIKEKITPGRHCGRQMDGNGAEENPGTLAAQGVELGRHWVDMGAGGAWPGAPLFLKKRVSDK